MNGQAICKDCGNGTQDNAIDERFVLTGCPDCEGEFVICMNCGSSHIDGELTEEL
jgi:hypothetical protein